MNANKIAAGMLALACGIFAGAAAQAAAPASGAYVTDSQNTWVQDRVGDRISTVNMIMCIMGAMRADLMINQGSYLALINQTKCKGQSDASNATTTNAGASNATNYMSAVINATQATAADPLTVKAWMRHEEQGNKMLIYAYMVATASASTANPNGLFSMYFCGIAAAGSPTTCMFSGTLKSDATGLTFYESEGSFETRLKLQQADITGGSGIGNITGTENGTAYAYNFAYNPTYFRRKDNTGTQVDACFARDGSSAKFSTWRYGTYKQDGTRLDITNPGFSVKFADGSNTHYGYWGFWGLWLPPSALANITTGSTLTRQVAGTDQSVTVVKQGGKLWKFSRQSSTLADFKNAPLNYSACQSTGSGPGALPAGGDSPCTNYTLKWDGTNLQAVGKNSCSGGSCAPVPITAINLTASDFTAVGANSLWIFSPAGDGVIKVPSSGNFSGATELYYRTRNVVVPGSATAPSSLVCVNSCPTSYVSATPVAPWASITAQPWGGGTPASVSSAQNWGPVATGSAISYTYDGMLKRSGTAINYSTATAAQMAAYQWGLQSGFMIDSSDAGALAAIKCDSNGAANPSGTNYCPWLANQASTSYQWETGPNQWNQYFGATSGGTAVTFDPPKNLAFAATGSNIRAADVTKYAGSTVRLQFSGFGELQGIPGSCVNPDTNQPANCSQSTRWVPAFDIIDGSIVSDGSTDHYVKYLEREMRLNQLTGANETTCRAALSLATAAALTLPTSSAMDVNPRTTIGTEPTLTTSKPAVIHGVVQ